MCVCVQSHRFFYLVCVEDEVQLAHILEAFVERLHEDLDEVQDAQVALLLVHREDEVERGVVAVDYFCGLAPLCCCCCCCLRV